MLLLWTIGPYVSDLLYRHLYKAHFFTPDEFLQQYPELATFIQNTCHSNTIPMPKIGIIDDQNPTAFTYGSGPWNSRILFTKGLTTYLNPQELKAVFAHEIGHIVHYDFVVMAMSSLFVQILYELYVVLTRSGKKGNEKNPLAAIGILSYIFYILASYLLLYLSRIREYYADHFSAQITRSPNLLAQALVKIAYGITQAADTNQTKRLLESTRNLGIIDSKKANIIYALSQISQEPQKIVNVLAFDIVNPWAKILELSSTHPLTGKRILALSALSEKMGEKPLLDFKNGLHNLAINRKALYSHFYTEVCIYFLPYLLLIPGFLTGGLGGALIGFALGAFIKLNYSMKERASVQSTVLQEMSNIYASPLRGSGVLFNGAVVGRGVAGYQFSEDMLFQDTTGLIYLDYNSVTGWLGNLFFALGKVKKYIGQQAHVDGWFFRGTTHHLTMRTMSLQGSVLRSHPKLWKSVGYAILLLIGSIIALI